MKNIRKIVSIVLCMAMVMAMFVMSASAEAGTGTYTMIDKVENLTEGTYKMAGYAVKGSTTDFSASPYHMASGNLTATSNVDMITSCYSFNNGVLTPASSGATAADFELIAVAGKANTYYIKCNGKYLYSTATSNRRLA